MRERYERGRFHSHVARKAFEEPVLRHLGSANRTNSSDSIHPYLRMRLTTVSALPEVSASVPAMRIPDVGDPAVLTPRLTPLLDLFGTPSSLGQQTLLLGRDTSPPRVARRRIRFRGGRNYEWSGFKPERWGKGPFIGPSFQSPHGPRVKNERYSLRMVAKPHQFKNYLCTTPPASNTSIRTVSRVLDLPFTGTTEYSSKSSKQIQDSASNRTSKRTVHKYVDIQQQGVLLPGMCR